MAAALAMRCRQPSAATSTKSKAGSSRASPTWATVAQAPSSTPAASSRRQPMPGRQSRMARPATIRASNQVPGMIDCSDWSW